MNLDQTRAVLAYQHVEPLRAQAAEAKKYGAMALKLPILVRTAGLCQALHFVASRPEPTCTRLLDHLARQLHRVDDRITNAATLCERVRKADLQRYLHLTREATATLQWYARLAQSILKIDRTADIDESGVDHDSAG